MKLSRFTVLIHSLAGITLLASPTPAAFAQGADDANVLGQLSAPLPTAKSCGAPPARGIQVNKQDMLSSLKEAVSAMDPTGAYRATKRFAISGELSDFNRSQHSATTVGTFRIQEDHTVADGNFSREFVVNGVSSNLTRTNGQVASTPGSGASDYINKLAFVPKSYIFPLALFQDELENKNVVAYSVPPLSGIPVNRSLASLQHILVVNLSSSKTTRYEVEDWYFDPNTHLPVFVRHEQPTLNRSSSRSSSSCVAVYTHFGDYQNVSGTLVPTSVYTEHGGASVRTFAIQALTY